MKTEGKYILGAIHEIAKEIAKNIIDNDCVTYESIERFKPCDFSVFEFDCVMKGQLSELFQQNETGIYGIKRINTGFDNDNLELFADYYGGGNGCYKEIVVGANTEEECVNSIISLIIDTIKFDYPCNENTILIVEWC